MEETQNGGELTYFSESYSINQGCRVANVMLGELKFVSLSKQPPRSPEGTPVALRLKKEFKPEDFGKYDDESTVKIGLCARDHKIFCKPMLEIVGRLLDVYCFEIVIIHDDVMMNVPVEHWPVVSVLLSFYSQGFTLDKAIAYADLRKPYLPNDLRMQYVMQDRVKIYRMLRQEGIDVPRYTVVDRDPEGGVPQGVHVVELDDGIQVDHEVFMRPLVEKPVSADDHNVCIYFPQMMGGGCQRLFRKIGNRSSIFCANASFRRNGSYIYEEFLPTDGTDVKVYSVGLEYAHAEARKSPSLDGIVERDSDGNEIRYPVILSAYEKILASKITRIFKQTVCGFDLLRTKGRSVVCDVNGFSFVKKSQKYYDDCACILTGIVAKSVEPFLVVPPCVSNLSPSDSDRSDTGPGRSKNKMELRCVIAVMRHADRTPKQKMKMVVQHERFMELFKKHGGNEEGQVKLKTPKELQEVLNITRELIKESFHPGAVENPSKLLQMKYVLEMYECFSGINRKIQIKSLTDDRNAILHYKFKGHHHVDLPDNTPILLLILKWGGELTEMGLKQSNEMGKLYRSMYPSETSRFVRDQTHIGDCAGSPGHQQSGLLRLHSTYRHDLKIYASDEGRVQLTAAAFAKGFLALESSITSILVHLVSMDRSTTLMLNACNSAEFLLEKVKSRLHNILKTDRPLNPQEFQLLAPTKSKGLLETLKKISNPRETCESLHILVKDITSQIKMLKNSISKQKKQAATSNSSTEPVPLACTDLRCASGGKDSESMLFHQETLALMERRWSKLEKDFKQDDSSFNISIIPDIYDCAKYDFIHNIHLNLRSMDTLFDLSKTLANAVIPLEYGISVEEKVEAGKSICMRLLKKIRCDLAYSSQHESTHRLDTKGHYDTDIISTHRHVRSRFYFTSESHIYGLFNTFWYGGLFDETCFRYKKAARRLRNIQEFDFLSQIVIIQYEDTMVAEDSPERFHIEVLFSPGSRNQIQRPLNSLPNTPSSEFPVVGNFNNCSEINNSSNSCTHRPNCFAKKRTRFHKNICHDNLDQDELIESTKDDHSLYSSEAATDCLKDSDLLQYNSDGELYSLIKSPYTSRKIKFKRHMLHPTRAHSKLATAENSDFYTDPLFPLGNPMTLDHVNKFLDNVLDDSIN